MQTVGITLPLSNKEIELADSEIRGHKVLLLVEITEVGGWGFLYDDGDSVWVLSADLLSFGTALVESVLFLVAPLHDYACWLIKT